MAFGHHSQHPPDDDVEAHAADHSSSSDNLDLNGGKELGEFEALDRFITTFDASGHHGAHDEEKAHKPSPWWKFWKSDEGEDDYANHENAGKPPPAWLETDIRQGVNSNDVAERRRRFGWNELTAEKENQLRKFLSFFQGPILYGE